MPFIAQNRFADPVGHGRATAEDALIAQFAALSIDDKATAASDNPNALQKDFRPKGPDRLPS